MVLFKGEMGVIVAFCLLIASLVSGVFMGEKVKYKKLEEFIISLVFMPEKKPSPAKPNQTTPSPAQPSPAQPSPAQPGLVMRWAECKKPTE